MGNYRDSLIMAVRRVGETLVEKAENFVPTAEYMTDFNIDIHFENDGGIVRPTVHITSDHNLYGGEFD